MRPSELAQAMSDAGAPMAAILIALRAIEERDEQIEAKRTVERERKRRQRANADGTVTGQSRDSHGDIPDRAFPAPPNENILTPPTHTPGNKPRARKGTRLAADWSPEPLSADCQAIVSRWKPGEIDLELSKFRDFWAAKAGSDGSKLDWQATWRNWLRAADGRQNGKANRTNSGTGQTRGDGFLAAIREVNNRPFDADRSGYAGGVRNPEGMGLLPASTA